MRMRRPRIVQDCRWDKRGRVPVKVHRLRGLVTKAVFTIVKNLAYSLAMERARADSRVSWRAWACLLLGLFFL